MPAFIHLNVFHDLCCVSFCTNYTFVYCVCLFDCISDQVSLFPLIRTFQSVRTAGQTVSIKMSINSYAAFTLKSVANIRTAFGVNAVLHTEIRSGFSSVLDFLLFNWSCKYVFIFILHNVENQCTVF